MNKSKWVGLVDEYEQHMKTKNVEKDKLALSAATGVIDPNKMEKASVEALKNYTTEVPMNNASSSSLDGSVTVPGIKQGTVPQQLDVIGEED